MENRFTEEDVKKVVQFLNTVAKYARWKNPDSEEMSTDDVIEVFKQLSFMQQILIPKLEANILEITKVVEAQPEDKPAPRKRGRTKKA